MKNFEIEKSLIDEYFEKTALKNQLIEETKIISSQIKHEMNKREMKKINIHGYKIKLETKYRPNRAFFDLLLEKGLGFLITPTISSSNLRKAKRRLKLSENKFTEAYNEEIETKWLHVKKD